jgi:hypothetical protein
MNYEGFKFLHVDPYVRLKKADDGSYKEVEAFLQTPDGWILNPEWDQAEYEECYAIPPGKLRPTHRAVVHVAILLPSPNPPWLHDLKIIASGDEFRDGGCI